MVKRPNDIPNYLDLVANLEEFGLSKYESMAYITLVSRGTLGASEVAYYSNLPRTKIYTTLKKLERKKLSTISSQKPMIATATSPSEAFGQLITLQERRLESMYNILDNLKKLKEDDKKAYEEKKYLILEPTVVVQKLEELILSTKSIIHLILDSWGQNVVFQCKTSLAEIIRRGVKVNILLGTQSIITNSGAFPSGVEIRSDNVSGNILIFDFKKIIFIDSTDGKASQILTADSFGATHVKLFEEKWNKALRINPAMLNNKYSKQALILSKMVETEISKTVLDLSIKQDKNYTAIIEQLEKLANDIKYQSIEEIIKIIDYAMRICYQGSIKYENQNNMLKLYFDSKEKSLAAWALIVMAYLKKFGNDPIMIYDHSEAKANTIYIQLQHPNVIHVN